MTTRTHRMPRALRRVAIVAIVIIATLLATSIANVLFEQAERSPQQYGHRVDIGDGSLNVYEHGDTGPTIVMLTGFATASPALDYAPLIRELDDYRVIVVEGFGYGYADTSAPTPRTVENITRELHTVLSELNVTEPYILLGHSIAGLYTLYYANEYRSEVAAVVGIDASVPGQMNGLAGGRAIYQFGSATGLWRLASTIAPVISEPEGTDFTAREREQIRLMTNWLFAAPAVVDEADQGAHNFAVVENMTYPSDVPVLSFIKMEGNQDHWKDLHVTQLANLDNGRLIELDGGHYLHWTHSGAIAESMNEFLTGAGIK